MRSSLRLEAGLAVFLAAALAGAAPSRVRIVTPKNADPIVAEATTRLRAELETEGFEVESVASTSNDPRVDVESASDAFASIAISSVGASAVADVWVADHVTGKTLVRRVDAADAARGERSRALAIRAVDLVRASLLEVAVQPPKTVVPRDVARWVAPPPRPVARDVWSIHVGLATTKNVGFGPTIAPMARASREVSRAFGVRVTWVGPTFGADITSAPGSAEAHQLFALAEMTWMLRRGFVSPGFAFGAGVADTFARGNARSPLVGTSEQGFSFALGASTMLAVRVARHVSIVFETGALVIAPARAISMLGVDIGNRSPVSWLSTLAIATSFE